MDGLDLIIKLATLSALILGAQAWVIRRMERGQASLREQHKVANAALTESINRTMRKLTKKLKHKVSIADCEKNRAGCPCKDLLKIQQLKHNSTEAVK